MISALLKQELTKNHAVTYLMLPLKLRSTQPIYYNQYTVVQSQDASRAYLKSRHLLP